MNLALHPGRWPFFLEKWYIDTLLADGTVLLIYLARMQVFGVPVARVTAELFRPGEAIVRGDASATAVRGDGARLEFGPATIDGDSLAWRTAGLSGELSMKPRHGPAVLRSPFLCAGDRRLDWIVEIPDADVTGRVTWPGGALDVEGRGYRDRVWFDLLPWRFPIERLVWGRAFAGPHASTWVEATTPEGAVGARWDDGAVGDTAGARPEMSGERVLLESAVVDLEGLRFGPIRPILRRLTRDPREIKWAAQCDLHGESGRAIHEVVRWG